MLVQCLNRKCLESSLKVNNYLLLFLWMHLVECYVTALYKDIHFGAQSEAVVTAIVTSQVS